MDLSVLNPEQLKAVETTEGPLLVLAGAGSGKTKVITYRIANIIEQGTSEYSILALTFTNKAAREMRERLETLLKKDVSGMWIGTFHSMCLRILHKHIEKLGYSKSFGIYAAAEQTAVIKACMAESEINKDKFKPSFFLSSISNRKNVLESPDDMAKKAGNDYIENLILKVYRLYQQKLKLADAVDFDDIIMLTVKLFTNFPAICEEYSKKFRYILVDEYQDTNFAQYRLISMLSSFHGNICVVGDDDQSIYGWRGADLRNILDFEKENKKTCVIKLERNYRSTKPILDAAYAVISQNVGRKDKHLWTSHTDGEKILLLKNMDEKDEANRISSMINDLIERDHVSPDEIAVLYRMNAQSRAIEESLVSKNIRYRVYGSLKYYERKEIKDIFAYLKFISNHKDDISFRRIINEPKRAIGLKTLEKLENNALDGESMYDAIKAERFDGISSATAKKLTAFIDMIDDLTKKAGEISLEELYRSVIKLSGYEDMLKKEETPENTARLDNLEEFVSVINDYTSRTEDSNLADFLTSVSLASQQDVGDDEQSAVSLMTLHSSKGLEFDTVFLAGMEEGIFPTSRALENDIGMEEERRLCYVGMTRAKRRLILSYSVRRMLYGNTNNQTLSRFLHDIPQDIIETFKIKYQPAKNTLTNKYKAKYNYNNRSSPDENKSTENLAKIKPGDKIKHPLFGVGTIVSSEGTMYTVSFEKKGVKKIDLSRVKVKLL